MSSNSNDWTPPVLFYFEVKFALAGGEFKSSFLEIDGLDQELVLEEQTQQGEATAHTPKSLKHSPLTLKRPLQPMDDNITKWIRECFNFSYTCKINPCSITISLLDSSGSAVAAWKCRRTTPQKWSLGGLDSTKNEIAVETLVLKHEFLSRIL